MFWLESRPSEQGRGVIVKKNSAGIKNDLFPSPFSARSGVHEYGGRCYCLGKQSLYFVNSDDQQIYSAFYGAENGEPQRITPIDGRRYADLEWDEKGNRILAVCEDHRQSGEAETSIVSIKPNNDLSEVEPETLIKGADFYAYPRISEDGRRICWIQWNHPQMPWFGSELWIGELAAAGVDNSKHHIGGEGEAIFQPSWHPDGQLYFCSDKTDYWNLYRVTPDGEIHQVSKFDGECGLPLWQFGMQTYGFVGEEKALCAICKDGNWHLHLLNLNTGKTEEIDSGLSLIHQVSSDGNTALLVSASPVESSQLQRLESNLSLSCVERTSNNALPQEDISMGKAYEFPTSDSMVARGFFYKPQNAKFEGPEDEKPPLVVMCHGGPTAATSTAINLKVQFWTSRGFAVFDVNYRGSTGFGRKYRQQLDGKWGIYDVEDACAAARYACQQGWADPDRTIIRGSSAGGLTVLNALAMHKAFKAGACLYGICDLKVLVDDTHKFEKRYGDRLIAPWPQGRAEYELRSPINHIEELSSPVIFFQGLKDKVVPPNQAEMMVEALAQKGIPVSYVTYADEGHGFRSSETILHSFNAELAFYGAIMGFDTDSNVTDLEIINLPT